MTRLTHEQIRMVTNGTSKNERQCPVCGNWHLLLFGEDDFDCKNDCEGVEVSIKLRNLSGIPNYRPPTATPPANASDGERKILSGPLTVAEYAKLKELPEDYLRGTWNLEDCEYLGVKAVAIPYSEKLKQYRGTGKTNQLFPDGSKTELYGLDKLKAKTEPIKNLFIVEGCSDAQTMHYCGFDVLGIPGVGQWKPEWTEEIRKLKPKNTFLIEEPDNQNEPVEKWTFKKADAWLKKITGCVRGLRLTRKDASEVWLDAKTEESFAGTVPQDTFRYAIKNALPLSTVKVKSSAKVESNVEPSEPMEVREEDIPEIMLTGRLGEWTLKNLSMFPRAYAWPVVLTIAGGLIPFSQDGTQEEEQIDFTPKTCARTNLYTCLIGPKSTGKSQCCLQAMEMFGLNPKTLPILNVKAGSMEGLSKRLKGQQVLYLGELGHLLEKTKIENASFALVLNDLYYEDEQNFETAKKTIKIESRLSILGGLVDERFDSLFGAETTGGFYDRFTFGVCPAGFDYNYIPYSGEIHRRSDMTLNAIEVTPGFYKPKFDAQKARPEMDHRVFEFAFKSACIVAAFDGAQQPTATMLDAAWQFAAYQHHCRQLFVPNEGENQSALVQNGVLNWMQKHANDGRFVRIRDMERGSSVAKRFGQELVHRVLKSLAFAGKIEIEWSARPKVLRLVL